MSVVNSIFNSNYTLQVLLLKRLTDYIQQINCELIQAIIYSKLELFK